MNPILLLGGNGQLGWELARSLACLGPVSAPDRGRLDLTDLSALHDALGELRPRVIVNAASWTDVDGAEERPEAARLLNARVPELLAREARLHGALLVHFSSDYVYGDDSPLPRTEDAPTAPLNAYGRSKLEGDQAILASGCRHLILRTSWLYGRRGRNFLLTMQRLLAEQQEVRVVSDQMGAPTWSRQAAEAAALMLAQALSPARGPDRPEPWGVYHVANAGETSWHGFAEAIRLRLPAPSASLSAISSAEYPSPARRPANSRLDCGKLERVFGLRLPPWEEALETCLAPAGDG